MKYSYLPMNTISSWNWFTLDYKLQQNVDIDEDRFSNKSSNSSFKPIYDHHHFSTKKIRELYKQSCHWCRSVWTISKNSVKDEFYSNKKIFSLIKEQHKNVHMIDSIERDILLNCESSSTSDVACLTFQQWNEQSIIYLRIK
jgi:hypothetical protein